MSQSEDSIVLAPSILSDARALIENPDKAIEDNAAEMAAARERKTVP